MVTYDLLKKLCKRKGVTIAKAERDLGFAKGSLCKIDKSVPRSDKIVKLADYFSVPIQFLYSYEPGSQIPTEEELSLFYRKNSDGSYVETAHDDNEKKFIFKFHEVNPSLKKNSVPDISVCSVAPRRIPVLGRVAAGIPIDAITDIVDWEEIPEEMAGEYFALQIKGDSMEPKISDGDVVIVRQQNDAESGDTVIVTVNGDDATCKRLKKYSEGIALVSNNPAYEPMIFSRDDIESKPIRILGRVVELRAKF